VVVLLSAGTAAASARTFYVSPSGNDSASGRSASHAWRSVLRVNKQHLQPGDTILFQGGATYSDDTLEPGWGAPTAGTAGAPITFGTYGDGKATLPRGIWLHESNHMIFENFNLGPEAGIEGTGSFDTIRSSTFTNFMGAMKIPVTIVGSHWVISHNLIDHTGDSGMLLRGSRFRVIGNTITNTGLSPDVTWGTHGIYLKATGSSVIGNTITNFRDDGVSVRYRNATVKDNTISGGDFGVAFFEYDTRTGTTRILDNTIRSTSVAGIYVSPSDIGGPTHENLTIRGNIIYRAGAGGGSHSARASVASHWTGLSLSKTKGRYRVHGNKLKN
jgi:parallel beta-helix repeat protein